MFVRVLLRLYESSKQNTAFGLLLPQQKSRGNQILRTSKRKIGHLPLNRVVVIMMMLCSTYGSAYINIYSRLIDREVIGRIARDMTPIKEVIWTRCVGLSSGFDSAIRKLFQ